MTKTEQVVTVRMDSHLHNALKELAHERRQSMNVMCLTVIREACVENHAAAATFPPDYCFAHPKGKHEWTKANGQRCTHCDKTFSEVYPVEEEPEEISKTDEPSLPNGV